ncbi:hypothetical protein JCM19236_1318 [Vibrio sp. JCM 19236]|nr:hypothetical protein JCM19236_1318 [Vibrio sp. JCM 19236]
MVTPVFTQFGNTDLGFLTTRDPNGVEVFVAFKGDLVLGVFYNKEDALNCIWGVYLKELNEKRAKQKQAKLTEEEEEQAMLEFFNKEEEERDILARLYNTYYQTHLKTAPTPEPTPEPTPPTKSTTPRLGR